MPKRQLDDEIRNSIEKELRGIMLNYKNIKDPTLRAKTRGKVRRLMIDLGVKPFGYSGLPDYMKE